MRAGVCRAPWTLGCPSRFCHLCRAGWVTCWILAPSAAGSAAGHLYLSPFALTSPLWGCPCHQRLFLPPEALALTQAASHTMKEKYLLPARLWILLAFPPRGDFMCGASSLVSVVKNYLEKGFPISKAISESSRTQHLPSICSAVNSICKEKEAELGMRCGLLLRGGKELSPLVPLPRDRGPCPCRVPYLCQVWLGCVPDCFCPRCGVRFLWGAAG